MGSFLHKAPFIMTVLKAFSLKSFVLVLESHLCPVLPHSLPVSQTSSQLTHLFLPVFNLTVWLSVSHPVSNPNPVFQPDFLYVYLFVYLSVCRWMR